MAIASTIRRASICAALLVLAGCGDDKPAASNSARSAPPPTVTASAAASPAWKPPPGDAAGERACVAIHKINAVNAIEPDLDAVLAATADGLRSTNPGVAAIAKELDSAARALKAAGPKADLATTLAVGTAGLKLDTTCMASGYIQPGT